MSPHFRGDSNRQWIMMDGSDTLGQCLAFEEKTLLCHRLQKLMELWISLEAEILLHLLALCLSNCRDSVNIKVNKDEWITRINLLRAAFFNHTQILSQHLLCALHDSKHKNFCSRNKPSYHYCFHLWKHYQHLTCILFSNAMFSSNNFKLLFYFSALSLYNQECTNTQYFTGS